MNAHEVPEPILNSPFEEPESYWRISEHDPPEQLSGRRPAKYFYRPPGHEAANEQAGVGTAIELKLVNRIRDKLAEWRSLALRGEGGVTRTSMELMRYWRRDGRRHRLFFAQLEAAETIIFLAEAREDFLQGIDVPFDQPSAEAMAEGTKAFRRHACKMATGTGKTTVMGMLVAWSILNKVADRSDARYSDVVLVVCPNVIIRNRLEELKPQGGEASLYRTRDLVPSHLMPQLTQGSVLVTNWHVFEPKSIQDAGQTAKVLRAGRELRTRETVRIGRTTTTLRGKRYLTLDALELHKAAGLITVIEEKRDRQGNLESVLVESVRYVESDAKLIERVLGREIGGKGNILVMNDEAHHAYRIRRAEADENEKDYFGEEDDYEEFCREATVWVDGLDRVHKHRGINQCIDLSATPYFLGGAGRDTNRPFPWVVSDFGLIDAIESGLVKIPQLAVRDTSGSAVPGYFNIWRWILPRLTPAERGERRSGVKPEAVLKYAHVPLAMLGGLWEARRKEWERREDDCRPPVFIIVCNNTALAKVVYQWLAEDEAPVGIPPAGLDGLRNADGNIRTIRVDTKVVRESDSGQAKADEDRWMRATLDTVGKTDWPRDGQGRAIYPEGFEALASKLERPLHPPGRDVRCIVSVGMLTEGWDCNTVTHIVGLRPFMSQLLCEQVVGRGLRRSSYAVGEDGKLSEEVAKVFGIPFEIVPLKENPSDDVPKPAPETWRIRAVPEKAHLEIRFPRVEGYMHGIRHRVKVDWDNVAPLPLDPMDIPPEVEMKAGLLSNSGRPSLVGPGSLDRVDLSPFREGQRRQRLEFEMARDLTRNYCKQPGCDAPPHVLFVQLATIVQRYLREKVRPVDPAQDVDAFLSPWYGWLLERLVEAIQPDDRKGENAELPRTESGRGPGSTAEVDIETRSEPYPVVKSHINAVVPDTAKWEQCAAYRLDNNELVHSFVKNAGLGFAIPYLHNGEHHEYLPDFIVRLAGGDERFLILETKGYDPLKDVKTQAAYRWVRAVNASGDFGSWDYALISDPGMVDETIGRTWKKNWPPSTLTIDEFDGEIVKAQEFRPPLDEFILLTTAPNDIKVQDHVAGLYRDKNNGIDFQVEVYSWDEIRRRLSNYPNSLEKHYPIFFPKPIAAEIFDREIDDQLNRVIGAHPFGGVDTQQSALQLSERLARGDLRDASPSKRRHGLAWCARLLSVSDYEAAKTILDAAKLLGDCDEIAIADAFLKAAKGKTSDALAALNEINTSASRSAAFIIQWNNVGPKDALSWSADAGYDWKDYDNGGRTRLLLAASEVCNWKLVESCLEELASVNEPLTPALASVAARASLQLALPEEIRVSLDHSPPFFAKEFRLSSTARAIAYREQAIKLYQLAATELRSIGLDNSALVQEDFELWLRLSAPNSREEAKAELREQLKDKALRMRRAYLALQFGIEVDHDQLIKELDQEVARSGGGNIDTGCTALAIALTASSAQAALSAFRKRRATIERAIAKEHLIAIEIELLAQSKMGVEARHLISENRKLLGDSKIDDLDRIIKVAEGADPVTLLKEHYETDGELQTLAHLVDALFDRQAWESCHEYSAELFSRTKNFADAKRHVHVLTETRRFSDAIGVFEENPQFLEDPELRKVFSWSLYEVGQIVRCIEVAESDLLREHDPELTEILTNAYIAKGDWEKLPQQIENVWDKREKLSAQKLLQSAHLAQIIGHAREKALVRVAISKSETDGFAFAGAYFLATKGGWEESEEVAEWLHRAISLSDDKGPMYRADLREIVDKQLDWNEHATRTMAALRSAQCPIFVAAESLNRHLIEFSLSHAEANKNEDSRTSVKVIPSFSGKRPAIKIDEPRVGLDATCLMTLQSLGMLDAVFDHFDEVMLPHSTMSWLLEEISEVRYHQPSRVERAEALCQLILDGKVRVCGNSQPRVTKLEREIGEKLAALVAHADVDRSKGNPAFVVRGFPVSKAGSLGDESANLSGWNHLFVSTSSAVTFLRKQGRISITKQKSAIEYLALQETSWPEEVAFNSGCICYLDDLTISHLQHLELLECFCDSGVKVMIGAGTQADALALQKRKRHLKKIEEHLFELRQSLSREITSGRVAILANDDSNARSDEDRRFWLHPTISVFGSATAPNAIIVDDRFLNRHDTFGRADASSKIYNTLDILKTLQLQEKISENEYFNSLNALRERGHLFVPLEIEELRHHIKEAELSEGRLVVGHDLLQIKAYYLLARFSEWLTIPDDAHWLLRSNRLINDVIREQWKDVRDRQLAKAKSNWLFKLVDLRIWASDSGKTIHRGGVEGLWVANIVGLLAVPGDASREERQAYLAWLDEYIIQPLKHKHPQLFLQIVRYSRDLMENMLRANEERLNDG